MKHQSKLCATAAPQQTARPTPLKKITLLLATVLISPLGLAQHSSDVDVVSQAEFDAFKAEVTASMAGLTASIQDLTETIRNDYVPSKFSTLAVEGEDNKFYPVIFPISSNGANTRKIYQFQIIHGWHQKPDGKSRTRFYLEAGSDNWGNWPSYLAPISYDYYITNGAYIADYRLAAHGCYLVVWLKGNSDYIYQTEADRAPHAFLEETNLTALCTPDYAETHPDIVQPMDRVNQDRMVPNGFRRWDPSTYGTYHAAIPQALLPPQQVAKSTLPLLNLNK